MSRRFMLTVATHSGHLHDVSATVDGRPVLAGDGADSRTCVCEELPEEPVTVRVAVTGVPGSQYSIAVDLGNEDESFTWGYTLASSVQTVEFHV